MLSKNTLKYLQSLRLKKFRQKYGNFVVEGDKMAVEIIQHAAIEIEGLFAVPQWIAQYRTLLAPFQSKITPITEKELDRISTLKTPNKVFCVCKTPTYSLNAPLINQSLTLYLDGIQDPGNMGSILRIADWFGLPYVFCSQRCVEVYNSKVIQASMGAFLRVQTPCLSFNDLQAQFPNLPIFAAVLGGSNVFTANLPTAGVLVIGNEGNGISAAIQTAATHRIAIPKGREGGAESLNAAVATGILCGALMKGG